MAYARAVAPDATWYFPCACKAAPEGRIFMAGEGNSDHLEPRIGRSVSLDHAAELLGVSRRTIYNRIRDGRLQTIRTLGGSQRVLIDSVTSRGNQDERSHN